MQNKIIPVNLKLILFLSVNIIIPSVSLSKNSDLEFDVNSLLALGLDHEQIKKINSGNGDGISSVGVYINKKYIGMFDVDFKKNKPCLSADILENMYVDVRKLQNKDSCHSDNKIESNFSRRENALYLTMPDEFILAESGFKYVQDGGIGAFINYNANFSKSYSESFTSLSTVGININNYLVRTDFSYNWTTFSDGSVNKHNDITSAYIETEFLDKYRVRTGYISAGNSLFGAGRITGININSSDSLYDGDSTVTISGTATEFSIVELYQQGDLIFSRPVPAGHFIFENVSLITVFYDAELVIRGSSGDEQRRIISKALFNVSRQLSSNFSFFSGYIDRSNRKNEFVLGYDYYFPRILSVRPYIAGLHSENYNSFGLGSDINNLQSTINGNITALVSQSAQNGSAGIKLGTQFSSEIFNYKPYISIDWQDSGFQGINNYEYNKSYNPVDIKPKYSISAGMSKGIFKNFSSGISFNQSSFYGGMEPTNSLVVSSAYSIKQLSISSSLSYSYNKEDNDISVYVNVRLPLKFNDSNGTLSSSFNKSRSFDIYRIGYDHRIYDNLTVGGGVERSNSSGHNDRIYSQFFWKSPYTNTSMYYSNSGSKNDFYSVNLSGSVVANENNIVLSPEKAGDTFAIINTGIDGFVTVNTPTGNTITNYDGSAVAPNLLENKENIINIVTRSLPEDASIKNTREEIIVKYGTVGKVNFTPDNNRMYVINLIPKQGKFSIGSTIIDNRGNIIGNIVDENILLSDNNGLDILTSDNVMFGNGDIKNCQPDEELRLKSVIELHITCKE
ncbi:fimbria/pilus outer membrane usher protein [Morganella morganii]|nr:fimbrial biogenesis outer membrane usher protein [Morganella morganii]